MQVAFNMKLSSLIVNLKRYKNQDKKRKQSLLNGDHNNDDQVLCHYTYSASQLHDTITNLNEKQQYSNTSG